jgi:ribosome-associated heat shock protein Hsp15
MNDLKVRLDKYLWAIRIYKTRSQAGDAIDASKVKMNGVTLKASHTVKRGEQYQINTKEKKWLLEVVDVLDKRMKATDVAPYFRDLTPPEEVERMKLKSAFYYSTGGNRTNSAGRPTKKNRRLLDDVNETGFDD